MGNWKSGIKVGDLADSQKLELICRKCRRVTYTDKAMICESVERLQRDSEETIDPAQLYLDQIEAKARCIARGCRGHMRMAMVRLQEMSGFVGGLA
ncbi:DNA-directed RNA polymerase beta' subunit [Ochrobactrum anthropi]|uniref:hypothetical protein n=1 Tax=Brucella anthropi TaxID=529 RepID=UPI0015F877E9|nr:hypothetical protein [Brucella anthropi]MBA8862719.1 DNA-directed RNA polymerase beta' subunit [Brucella anthropi]